MKRTIKILKLAQSQFYQGNQAVNSAQGSVELLTLTAEESNNLSFYNDVVVENNTSFNSLQDMANSGEIIVEFKQDLTPSVVSAHEIEEEHNSVDIMEELTQKHVSLETGQELGDFLLLEKNESRRDLDIVLTEEEIITKELNLAQMQLYQENQTLNSAEGSVELLVLAAEENNTVLSPKHQEIATEVEVTTNELNLAPEQLHQENQEVNSINIVEELEEHFAICSANTNELEKVDNPLDITENLTLNNVSLKTGQTHLVDITMADKEENVENYEMPGDTKLIENNQTNKRSEKIVRKRVRKEEKWKSNIRRSLCQSGKEYINIRGKKVEPKKVLNKKDCLNGCKFKCSRKIGDNARNSLFNYYYGLSQNEKYVFLKQTTEKYLKGRKTTEQQSRRNNSFKYFFKVQEQKIQVCKQFFLGTLNISQKPVYTVHTSDYGIPKKDMRGKTGTQKIKDESKQVVIDHINQFNVVESHYCRENTKRKYLESTLTIPKMYELYLDYCQEKNIENPVKMSMYRRIFCTHFNYSFHKPKKDVCETCSNYYLKKKENRLNRAEQEAMDKHISEKEAMRQEKNRDKESNIPVICFDLENVITCPKSFVGNHFYLSKLSMYNLTGHLSTTNRAYCVLWIETLQGRTGNCIASAFRKIIQRVLEENHIEHLITWSDSCVPQNRNSHIAFCVLDILRNHQELKSVVMKYSVPGHGAVQEVDNIHSQIERHMYSLQYFSPLSFIRELKQVNKKNPFIIMQMREDDFKNYEECSKQLKYDNIPFTKICAMKFNSSDLTEVNFKRSHLENDFTKTSINPSILPLTRRRNKKSTQPNTPPELKNLIPKVLTNNKEISKEKIEALKKMMNCMPEVDQKFYKALLKL